MKSTALIYVITALFSLTFISETFGQGNRTNTGSTVDEVTGDMVKNLPVTRDISEFAQLMPKNLAEAGAGIGFANDFDDTRWCVKAGAITRVADFNEKAALYTGIDLQYEGSSQGDFSTNIFAIGGKFQLHSFITRTGEVQWVNGIKGHYVTGNQKFDSFKDDVSGVMGCYYTGINLKVCDGVFVGAETNIFTLEDLTIKNDNGDEFEQDDSSLRINQGNLINLTLRLDF